MSYRSVILEEQNYGGLPVGYWPLDEANGIVAADVLGLKPMDYGPNSGGVWTGGTLDNRPGPINRGGGYANLNGTSGYAKTGSGYSFTDSGTWELWLFPTQAVAATTRIWDANGKWTWANDGASAAGTVQFYDWKGPVRSIAAPVPTGVWTHVVFSCDKSAGRIYTYANGTLIDSVAGFTGFDSWSSAIFSLGCRDNLSAYFFKGGIAHAAIYNYAADQAFVDRHYLAGVNGTPDVRLIG